MSESSNAPAPPAGPPSNQNEPNIAPALVMNMQFIKDLSFEVPGAPEVFTTLRAQPNINLNLDVHVRRLNDQAPVFEVTLAIRSEATEPKGADTVAAGAEAQAAGGEGRKLFIAELAYCGVVTLNAPSAESVEPLLLVEVPRLLFPYARNILADVTRDGGFPPVLLQPIDFVALWQQRRAQAQAAQAAQGGVVGHA